LEHDIKDVLGIPDIAATILGKIDASDVFVGDVSFTAKGTTNDKCVPNANVMLELGYALGKLGYDKIIHFSRL